MPQIRGIMPLLRKPTGEGERIASEISQPFLKGLHGLAEQRMQDMQQRAARQRTASGLMEVIPGLTPEKAEALSGLSEKQLGDYFKVLQEKARGKAFQEALHGGPPLEGTESPAGEGLDTVEGEGAPLGEGVIPTGAPEETLAQTGGAPKIGEGAALSPEDQRRLAEMRQKDVHFAERQKTEAWKTTQAGRKELLDRERATLEDLDRVEIMSSLKDLNHPAFVQAMEAGNLKWMLSPTSQEFQKLRSDFVVNARALFGAKPAAELINRYLDSIPSLLQTPAGRERVYKTFKHLRQGALLRGQALRDIIKKNGYPPFDIFEQIEDRVQPKLEKLQDKFIEGMGGDPTTTVDLTSESVGQKMNVDPKNLPVGTRFRSAGVEYRVVKKNGRKEIEKV